MSVGEIAVTFVVYAIGFLLGYLTARSVWRGLRHYEAASRRGEQGKAKQREWLLWFHVKRLWDERDAAIRWADAWKAASADIDAERLAALARCADLEHELSRLQAVVCEEDYKSIGRVLSGPSTVATEAKAFIEQASVEVQEEAARLAAIDWERVERALNESREITAKLSDLRKIDPDVCNRPMDI